MKFSRLVFITLAVIVLGSAALWQFFLKGQLAYADIASAYVAKQTCSCRFVAERELESCLGDFTQDVSILSVSEIESLGEAGIQASALGLISATAVHKPGGGCVLRP
ncbi:MAG: hypothetical protein AAGF33_10495 [Pseudomonadota bacterium]